jgi:hypothetical protein
VASPSERPWDDRRHGQRLVLLLDRRLSPIGGAPGSEPVAHRVLAHVGPRYPWLNVNAHLSLYDAQWMTLTDNEGYVILAAIVTALLVGFATRRAALSLLPFLGAVGFLAYTFSSEDRYSRIPEDVQVTVVYALLLSVAMILVGVVIRRIVDAERLRRRTGQRRRASSERAREDSNLRPAD